ncbi:MAG: UDP-N-acetylmuramate dehydrogenase [Thermodesulfobacterium sp.]|nr:UDP-N-acetylmuramate dehydrogenase [Thermodesulfobacterium sp.]
MWFKDLDKKLKELKTGFKTDEPLAPYTSIKIGGPCKRMIFPEREESLLEIINFMEKKNIPFFLLGGGSKLLISDKGFEGAVINLRNLKKKEIIEENEKKFFLDVLAGTRINEIIGLGIKKGFGGIEFLGGIPATLGGAIKMNAGAFGHTISQVVKKIKIYKNGEVKIIDSTDSLWEYRKFKEIGIVLGAELELQKMKPEEVKKRLKEYLEKRKKRQPLFEKTFGSVFKNPASSYAGTLIESCNLKGYQIGNAKISEKHANFIVNLGGAKATDVLDLMKLAQERVFKKFGIILEPEVNFLGCQL